MKKIYFLPLAAAMMFSCSDKEPAMSLPQGTHQVVVTQTTPAKKYSIMEVSENDNKFWISSSKIDVAVGDTLYFTDALKQMNFEVKELNKVFNELYMINDLSKTLNPSEHAHGHEKQGEMVHPNTKSGFDSNIEIDAPEDGITIAELFTNADKYIGKKVKLKGKVVKFNEAILSKNWIHLQDGSGDKTKNNFDITITTNDAASVGDIIVMEGILEKDVDFGAGYKYDLIVQNASIIEQQPNTGSKI